MKFAGKVFVRESDPVRLEGHWVNHPKYGRQFEADFMGHDLEMDPDGLANFLANHPDVKGIGPVKARLIADAFRRAASTRRSAASPRRWRQSRRCRWRSHSTCSVSGSPTATSTPRWRTCRRFGLTHHQVTTLVGKFGSQVVPILESDPYVLVREIPGFGFKRVDKIARKMGTPKDLPSRIRAGLHYCVLDALDDGDCWVEYEDLLDRANTLLVMDTLDSREVIEGHLEALIAEGALVSPALRAAGGCRSRDPPDGRRNLAAVLQERAASPARMPCAGSWISLLDAEGPELNPEQREAVKNVLRYSISLMTGGAGSGKTYAVSTIASIAERPGVEGGSGGAHRQGRQAARTGGRPRGEHDSSAAGFQRPHAIARRAETDRGRHPGRG